MDIFDVLAIIAPLEKKIKELEARVNMLTAMVPSYEHINGEDEPQREFVVREKR